MSDARDTNALSDVGVAAPPASALEGANVAAPALGAPPASQGAAPAAISGNATPSLFGGILRGALAGLAGSAGARSASQAFGMGAAAQASQAQQDIVNQQQQDQAAQQKQAAADAHMLSQQQYANATLNYQMLAAKFATMPKNLQEELEQNQQKTASELENMGALVGQPYKSKGEALQAATAYNQTALQKGDQFTHAIPLERSDGTFGVYAPSDQKNSQPIDITLADGKKVTVPAGQMDGKTFLSTQVAIAKDKFDKSVQEQQILESKRHNQEMELIAKQNANTKETAADNKPKDMVVGTDSQGKQVAGTAEELKAAGVTNATKLGTAEAGKVNIARQLTSPNGLISNVERDLDEIKAKYGEQSASDARWQEFMAGKVGDGTPEFVQLRTDAGLLSTALMQAHVGSKGGEGFMEHFKNLADSGKMNGATLRTAIATERRYVEEKAMRPSAASSSAAPKSDTNKGGFFSSIPGAKVRQ